MRNLQFTGKIQGEVKTLVQIQKRTANRLFNEGQTIYMQSSNFHPFGAWSTCYDCNINNFNNNGTTFEAICNNFSYYNCQNNETGKYITFYKAI